MPTQLEQWERAGQEAEARELAGARLWQYIEQASSQDRGWHSTQDKQPWTHSQDQTAGTHAREQPSWRSHSSKGASPARTCACGRGRRDMENSSSRERGEQQQGGPLYVQVLFLFGSRLAPAPGRVDTKRVSPVMAGFGHGGICAALRLGRVVAAEPGVRDKTHALLPTPRPRPGLRGSAPSLLHPLLTVRRRPHSAPLRACRPKHSQHPPQPHSPCRRAAAEPWLLPADRYARDSRSLRSAREHPTLAAIINAFSSEPAWSHGCPCACRSRSSWRAPF
jgi:hypothetical protein